MRFPAKAPDIPHTSDQKLLKSVADPIIGNAPKIIFPTRPPSDVVSAQRVLVEMPAC
jgi:hypothetical protein